MLARIRRLNKCALFLWVPVSAIATYHQLRRSRREGWLKSGQPGQVSDASEFGPELQELRARQERLRSRSLKKIKLLVDFVVARSMYLQSRLPLHVEKAQLQTHKKEIGH